MVGQHVSIFPQWMQDQRRWRAEMEAQSPVSGEDDSTTASNQSDEEEKEEEEKEEEEEDPVEREEGCKKKLAEAIALIREQNDEISALQGQADRLQAEIDRLRAQADRSRAEAVQLGRLAFNRQVTIGARDRLNTDLREALEQRRRNCRCQGLGPIIRRRQCLRAAQPAVRAPRRAQAAPAPMQRRIGRVAKNTVRRPYPK